VIDHPVAVATDAGLKSSVVSKGQVDLGAKTAPTNQQFEQPAILRKTAMWFDRLFKVGVLVLGVVFAAIYFLDSQNSRYTYHPESGGISVVDTRTGRVYALTQDKWIRANPISGLVSTRNLATTVPSPAPAPK
jgi:hypothetical protein